MKITAKMRRQFRDYLCDDFSQRRKRNPSFSLRAYSRLLKVNDSSLSQMMRGQRKITATSMQRIAERLDLSLANIGISVETASPTLLKSALSQRLSHWYYDAILELAEIGDVPFTPQALAKRLGIHPLEAQKALRQLRKLEFLNTSVKNPANLLGSSTNIQDPTIEDLVAKNYQEGLLVQSQQAIFQVPKPMRDHTSLVLSLHPSLLKKIRSCIADCRKQILSIVNNSDLPKTEVYATQFSVFPLSKSPQNEDK